MDKVDYLLHTISQFDGWALIGVWAAIGTNNSIMIPEEDFWQ